MRQTVDIPVAHIPAAYSLAAQAVGRVAGYTAAVTVVDIAGAQRRAYDAGADYPLTVWVGCNLAAW